PYIDQAPVFNNLTFNGANPGWAYTGTTEGTANGTLLQKASFNFALCPSSPMDTLAHNNFNITNAQYYGISGATDGNGFTNQPGSLKSCCTCCGNQGATGLLSGSGMLVIARGVGLNDCSDGSSQTVVVGEASMFIYATGTTSRTRQVNGAHG